MLTSDRNFMWLITEVELLLNTEIKVYSDGCQCTAIVHKTNTDCRVPCLIEHAPFWKDGRSDVTFFLNTADGFIPITYTATVTWLGFLTGCVRGDQLDSSRSAWHLFTWEDLMLLRFRKKNTSVQVTTLIYFLLPFCTEVHNCNFVLMFTVSTE